MLGLQYRVGQQAADMLVLEPVEHAGSVPASGDDAGQTQFREMLGHGRRSLVDHVCEMIDGHLTDVLQVHKNPDGRGVSEHPEDLRRQLDMVAVQQPTTPPYICVHANILT